MVFDKSLVKKVTHEAEILGLIPSGANAFAASGDESGLNVVYSAPGDQNYFLVSCRIVKGDVADICGNCGSNYAMSGMCMKLGMDMNLDRL